MLTKLNSQRLNFVLPIGRRFWTACAMLLRHFKNIKISDTSASLNGNYFSEVVEEQVNNAKIYFDHEDGIFDPFSSCNVVSSDPEQSQVYQLFAIFDNEMFLNVYDYINLDEFLDRYLEDYSKDVALTYYAASKCIIPIEANICNFKIKTNSGRPKYLSGERYPLIDVMYRSDEMVNFIKYLTSIMMFSSHMFYVMYNDISENISDTRRNCSDWKYYSISNTWDPNMIHFSDFFSS